MYYFLNVFIHKCFSAVSEYVQHMQILTVHGVHFKCIADTITDMFYGIDYIVAILIQFHIKLVEVLAQVSSCYFPV